VEGPERKERFGMQAPNQSNTVRDLKRDDSRRGEKGGKGDEGGKEEGVENHPTGGEDRGKVL